MEKDSLKIQDKLLEGKKVEQIIKIKFEICA